MITLQEFLLSILGGALLATVVGYLVAHLVLWMKK